MANTEIDSLSLNISINGLSDRDIQNLESLANSIAKLQRNLRKLELSKLQDIKIPENVKGITGVTYDSPTFDLPQGFDEMFKDVEETFSPASDKMQSDLGKINTDVDKLKVNTKGFEENTKKALNPKKNTLNKQLNGVDKTLRRIKVISFIKLIRGAINSFVRGLGSGIKNLAMFDSQFNETMSSLSTAKTQIFNSLALTISPFITSLTPLITTLSNGLVNISNTVSQITASIKGMSTYTKINTKYTEDYAKSLQKAQGFSFDTFQSLNLQDSMFETANVDDEQIENYEEMYSIIQNIKDIFETISGFVKDVGSTIGSFIKQNLGNINDIVARIKEFASVIVETSDFSIFSNTFSVLSDKVLPVIIKIVGAILGLVEKIMKAISPLTDVITGELLPALLELTVTTFEPIYDIITDLSPIIESIIKNIVEILVPIIQKLVPIIQSISNIVGKIQWAIDYVIGDVLANTPETINRIFEYLQPIVTIIEKIVEAVAFIVDAIESLLNGDWDAFAENMKNAFKQVGLAVLKFFAGFIDGIINAFISFINFIIANDVIKAIVKWFGGGEWKGITDRSHIAEDIKGFANGGIVGEVWQMNEHGNPEMLFNANNSGNTSVINVDQLSEAFERAIYNTGLLGAIEEGKVVYIDGRAIAQSKNFKNEINRTNPTLNIK